MKNTLKELLARKEIYVNHRTMLMEQLLITTIELDEVYDLIIKKLKGGDK